MIESLFRFELVVDDPSRSALHREEVSDLGPVYQDLLFRAVASGALPNDGALPLAVAEPLWPDAGGPRVRGLRVSLSPLSQGYGRGIVADRVLAILAASQEDTDAVDDDRTVRWWIEARPRDGDRPPSRRLRLSRQPFPLVDRPLASFGIAAPPAGPTEVAVFVARDLIAALRRETAESLECERADILTGQLVRDPGGGLAAVVSGRVPADVATSASATHFSFSPLTFVAAQRAVAEAGASVIGWHHNHPPRCGRQCLALVPPCATGTLFFSPDDRAVHRASFAAPYMVALVTGKEADRRADEPGVRAWGWRNGTIVSRPFTVF